MIRKAVLDAGPLFSALAINYRDRLWEQGRNAQLERALQDPLLTRANQQSFMDLLKSITVKLTTSHVIAELHGLQKARLGLKAAELESFWSGSIQLLRLWNIDENLVRLLDMATDPELLKYIPIIGLVDAGIIELASSRQCGVITQDERTLSTFAHHRSVRCWQVKELVP